MSTFDLNLFLNKIKRSALSKVAKGGWIDETNKSMKKKGTKGIFTEWCGGKVTDDCIKRGLKSKDEKIRKRAQLAKTFREMRKKEKGGNVETDINISTYIDDLKKNYLSKINSNVMKNMLYDIADKAVGLEEAYGNYYQSLEQINKLTKELYGGIIEYQEGGETIEEMPAEEMPVEEMPVEETPTEQPMEQNVQGQDITYEQYVSFVMQYPEYFQRLLMELQQQQQQVQQQQVQQ